ncbi:hypothetical protein NE237_002687 [Protea cynaroides]|uniref:Uncharacterized protein n=1 Tax=Protea cynaroides TaxID=273540 RepID=A0A9Q0GLJ8_9MAGN|nr:hypothetical protein NE237_002687 [Protea cynaroides]
MKEEETPLDPLGLDIKDRLEGYGVCPAEEGGLVKPDWTDRPVGAGGQSGQLLQPGSQIVTPVSFISKEEDQRRTVERTRREAILKDNPVDAAMEGDHFEMLKRGLKSEKSSPMVNNLVTNVYGVEMSGDEDEGLFEDNAKKSRKRKDYSKLGKGMLTWSKVRTTYEEAEQPING